MCGISNLAGAGEKFRDLSMAADYDGKKWPYGAPRLRLFHQPIPDFFFLPTVDGRRHPALGSRFKAALPAGFGAAVPWKQTGLRGSQPKVLFAQGQRSGLWILPLARKKLAESRASTRRNPVIIIATFGKTPLAARPPFGRPTTEKARPTSTGRTAWEENTQPRGSDSRPGHDTIFLCTPDAWRKFGVKPSKPP